MQEQVASHEGLFQSSARWADYSAAVDRLIRDAMTKTDASEQAIEATIQVNTNAMIDRVNEIVELLGIQSHHTIGDFGCGYGFMPLLMHCVTGAKIDAYDRSEGFLALGRSFADAEPQLANGVRFNQFDYLSDTLDEDAGPYDVILLNNTLQYVVGREQKLDVIRRLSAMLKPNGTLMIFVPNPVNPREPFTRLPIVHWLPRAMAKRITTKLGRRDLSDIDYTSYPGLRKLARQAGLERTRYHPNGRLHNRLSDGVRVAITSPIFCRSFALVGRAADGVKA